MKNLFLVSFAVASYCLHSSGQTKFDSAASRLYDLQPPSLRMLSAKPESKSPATSLENAGLELRPTSVEPDKTTSAFANLGTLSERDQDEFLQLFHRMDGFGYFDRPSPDYDSPLVHWAKGTFEPEIVHLGKTTLSCSLLTATKRRNPFCLINPVVLSFSW